MFFFFLLCAFQMPSLHHMFLPVYVCAAQAHPCNVSIAVL